MLLLHIQWNARVHSGGLPGAVPADATGEDMGGRGGHVQEHFRSPGHSGQPGAAGSLRSPAGGAGGGADLGGSLPRLHRHHGHTRYVPAAITHLTMCLIRALYY